MKIEPSDIDDIFGIPRDGSNIVDDEETDPYSGKGDALKVSFAEKTEELGKEINNLLNKKTEAVDNHEYEHATNIQNQVEELLKKQDKIVEKSTLDKKEEKPINKKKDVETSLKSVVPNEPRKSFDDLFADDEKAPLLPKIDPIQSQAKVEVESEKIVQHPAKVDDSTRELETGDDSKKAQLPQRQSDVFLKPSGKMVHRWKTTEPAPKYASFYREKRDALENELLIGGEIDFDQFHAELEKASVDISVGDTFVAELVCKKMEEVQRWRDRIKHLQLQVNKQYFRWERSIDLFEGLLSRVEYERGKQDGLKYEHMYDMEMYFGSLKSLHKSIECVSKTLDGAFECLSRQVTVIMPTKELSDRYNPGPKNLAFQLSKFDGLKTNANSGGSVSTRNQKDGPKGPEPTKGWES